jgi:hypothetical protein
VTLLPIGSSSALDPVTAGITDARVIIIVSGRDHMPCCCRR